MTAPQELPELPEPVDARARVAFGPAPDYYTADQMHAYARQAIAESEARAELAAAEIANLRQLCRDMLPVFQAARPLVLNLERLKDAAIAQEAKRETASA